MARALRVAFTGIEPVDMPLDDAQAAAIAPLMRAVATDPALAAMLWTQIEAAVRAELAKDPANAAALAAIPADLLRPDLTLVEIDQP